jgi:hypothetical protein
LIYFVVVLALYVLRSSRSARQPMALRVGDLSWHGGGITAPYSCTGPGPGRAALFESRGNLWFVFKWGMLALFVAVVPYLYLWLRAQQPGAWIWGDPATLAGLWRQMLGETYLRMMVWPTTLAEWWVTLQSVVTVWFDIQTWPIVMLGAFSLVWMLWRRQIRYGLAFLMGILVPFAMAVADRTFFGTRRLPEDIPALLQLATIFALLALAYLINDLKRVSPQMRRMAIVLVGALGIFLGAESTFRLCFDT